ncbi:hypothetical protein [Candidatus Paracaedibacter symbiosus]|uniref:hypothetical protein n=1 Tax=Candidatus Paracaedibacter symbiosus TaxID=244582 RepID=UPI0005097B3C|nr:hypothetical protein [Candidatus Paracaedibacter symbiosus]
MTKKLSIKKVLSNQNKLTDVQLEIIKLQEKEKALQNEIAINFSSVLSNTDALCVPHDVLVGGILNIVKSYKENTPAIGEWQQAGATFLQGKKSSKKPKNQNSPHSKDNKTIASNTHHD